MKYKSDIYNSYTNGKKKLPSFVEYHYIICIHVCPIMVAGGSGKYD